MVSGGVTMFVHSAGYPCNVAGTAAAESRTNERTSEPAVIPARFTTVSERAAVSLLPRDLGSTSGVTPQGLGEPAK